MSASSAAAIPGRPRQGHYPDGSTWYLASVYHLVDALIHHEITYWAEPFESPAWRAQWVERIPPSESAPD